MELLPCHRLTCVFVRLVSVIELTLLPGNGTTTHKQMIEHLTTNNDLRRSIQIIINIRNQLLHLPSELSTRNQWNDVILSEKMQSALHYVSEHFPNHPLVAAFVDCILHCERRYRASHCTCGFGIIFDACRILEHYLLPSSITMLFTQKVEAFSCNANVKTALRCIARIRAHALHTKYFEVSEMQRKAFNGSIAIIATQQNNLHLLRFVFHQTSRLYPCYDITEHQDDVGDSVMENSYSIGRSTLSVGKYDLPIVMVVSELLASPVDTSSENMNMDDTTSIHHQATHVQLVLDLLRSQPSVVLYVLLLGCVMAWWIHYYLSEIVLGLFFQVEF
jgi:hypothetical protein